MTGSWRVFVELRHLAPDGVTKWHSMTARFDSKGGAIMRAADYLQRDFRRYAVAGSITVCLAVGQLEGHSVCLEELPTNFERYEYTCYAEDCP